MDLCTLIPLVVVQTLSGCDGTDIFGPVPTEEVKISFSVSGGIAGVSYGVVVDGAAGEATLSCGSFCPGGEDGRVLPLSGALIDDLARRLDEAGVIEMGDQDFGTACCDMFGFAMTYERGPRSVRLQGTDALWPPEPAAVLPLLHAIASGRVPALVAFGTDAEDWPSDPLSLGDANVAGLTLTVEVGYGGGCAPHRMDLVAHEGWLESLPVQVHALLTHDDGDDACDAFVTEERVFDLQPLREAYEDAYGPIGSERPTVLLRLHGPGAGDPVSMEVVL